MNIGKEAGGRFDKWLTNHMPFRRSVQSPEQILNQAEFRTGLQQDILRAKSEIKIISNFIQGTPLVDGLRTALMDTAEPYIKAIIIIPTMLKDSPEITKHCKELVELANARGKAEIKLIAEADYRKIKIKRPPDLPAEFCLIA